MKRIKTRATTVAIPRDRAEAERMVAEIGAAMRARDVIQAALDETIAAAKTKAEADAAPHARIIAQCTEGLQKWAEANRAALTNENRTKTVRLATGEVSWRDRPASVRITGAEDVIARLHELKLDRFVRTKEEVDKAAMLKEPDVARSVAGVAIGSAGEEFIVTPDTTPLDSVEAHNRAASALAAS